MPPPPRALPARRSRASLPPAQTPRQHCHFQLQRRHDSPVMRVLRGRKCVGARECVHVEAGRGRPARLTSSVLPDSYSSDRAPAAPPSPAVRRRRVCPLMTPQPHRHATGPCLRFGESHLHLRLVCVCQSRSLSLTRSLARSLSVSLSLSHHMRLHLHTQRQWWRHPQAHSGQTLGLCRALRGGFCCWSRAAPPSCGGGYLCVCVCVCDIESVCQHDFVVSLELLLLPAAEAILYLFEPARPLQ